MSSGLSQLQEKGFFFNAYVAPGPPQKCCTSPMDCRWSVKCLTRPLFFLVFRNSSGGSFEREIESAYFDKPGIPYYLYDRLNGVYWPLFFPLRRVYDKLSSEELCELPSSMRHYQSVHKICKNSKTFSWHVSIEFGFMYIGTDIVLYILYRDEYILYDLY